jgi:hypothetical protein
MEISNSVISSAPRIKLIVSSGNYFSALELGSFIYDINLLHDVVVLSVLEDYQDYKLSRSFWYRKNRPVRPEHRLVIYSVRLESPVEIVFSIPAALHNIGVVLFLVAALAKLGAQADKWIDDSRLRKRDIRLKDLDIELKQHQVLVSGLTLWPEVEKSFKRRFSNLKMDVEDVEMPGEKLEDDREESEDQS